MLNFAGFSKMFGISLVFFHTIFNSSRFPLKNSRKLKKNEKKYIQIFEN